MRCCYRKHDAAMNKHMYKYEEEIETNSIQTRSTLWMDVSNMMVNIYMHEEENDDAYTIAVEEKRWLEHCIG
jgi:hypothetical protein